MSDCDNSKNIIICAGLSCLDLQLLGCSKSGNTDEAIETYDKAEYCAGGSATQTSTTLGLLTKSSSSSSSSSTSLPSIYVLTKLGNDFNGDKMIQFCSDAGCNTDLVLQDDNVQTSMAVLPVFSNGGRGCFVNLACNEGFTADEMINQLSNSKKNNVCCQAFLFGYPHLMKNLQGENLSKVLSFVKNQYSNNNNCLVGVDLNGVSVDNHNDTILNPSLKDIDILHLNEEEAAIICKGSSEGDTSMLHENGCAVVLLSLGKNGSKISVTSDVERISKCNNRCSHIHKWEPGQTIHIPAFQIDGEINTNGAGDALFAGFCMAATWQQQQRNDVDITLEQAGLFASLVAKQRCDPNTRDGYNESNNNFEDANTLMERVLKGNLPPTI